MDTAARAKSLFQDNDTKQKVFAAQYHLGESTLSSYLNGKHTMPHEVLLAIADYFDVSMDYLYGRTDIAKRPHQLSEGERALVGAYRTLSPEQKEIIVGNIKMMQEQNNR